MIRLIFQKIMLLQTNLTASTDMVMIVLVIYDECIKQHLLNILSEHEILRLYSRENLDLRRKLGYFHFHSLKLKHSGYCSFKTLVTNRPCKFPHSVASQEVSVRSSA